MWGKKYKIGKKLVGSEKVLANMEKYGVLLEPVWGGDDKYTGKFVEIPICERPFKISIPLSIIQSGAISEINGIPYSGYAATLSLFVPNFYDSKEQRLVAFFKTLNAADGFTLQTDGTIVCSDTNLVFEYIDTFEYTLVEGVIEKK